jgi:osmoprotectant transport system permease protein
MKELLDWFSETPDIGDMVFTHLKLSLVPVAAALLVAGPLGLYIGHRRRFEFTVVSLANLGRAIPSFGILALSLPIAIRVAGWFDRPELGLGFWPTASALFFLSIPPILTNTYIGIKGVDPDVVDAARGVGFGEREVMRRIEIPLAMPLIVAGVRTAVVQAIATATLGALVAAGGLGAPIVEGFRTGERAPLFGGAILVAVLAIAAEVSFGFLDRAVSPKSASRQDAGFQMLGQVPQVPAGGEI